jgi:hypothetical protein
MSSYYTLDGQGGNVTRELNELLFFETNLIHHSFPVSCQLEFGALRSKDRLIHRS